MIFSPSFTVPIITPLRKTLGGFLGQVLTPEIAAEIESTITMVTPPPWEKSSHQAMMEIMAGNADAVSMMGAIAVWSHVYDDLIDKDKPVSDNHIHQAMWTFLAELPENPFFRAHQDTFRPVLMAGVMNWHAANQMEKSGCLEQLRLAHAIRYSICDIAYLAMIFAGGLDHAVANASRCRLLMQYDTWNNYFQEHRDADPQ